VGLLPPCLLIWPVPSKNPALYCRCVWRFTADNLQDVQSSPAWQCPCCRPPPALALQYPPRSRHRTSLQLGSWERGLREETPFNSGSSDGIKRRPSHSGPSTPRRGVSASAEVQQSLYCTASAVAVMLCMMQLALVNCIVCCVMRQNLNTFLPVYQTCVLC